jgi:drug/metabolite transporter (DMT)-like permease
MQVRAQNASIVALLEPASAVVFAYLILSEPITASMLAGGVLILLGAVIISRERPVEIAHE